jgi:hypothetical protein
MFGLLPTLQVVGDAQHLVGSPHALDSAYEYGQKSG